MSDMNSLNEPNSSCLSFRSHDDALNFARHSAENVRRWIAAKNLNFAERYAVGSIEVVLKILNIRGDNGEYDLVFSAIPYGQWNTATAAAGTLNAEIHLSEGYAGGDEQSVLVDVVGLVECPNKIVPSLVRFERAKKRNDLIRNLFASSLDNSFEIRCVVANGEVSTSGVVRASGNSDGIPSLIERGPEVFEGVCGNISETIRDCGTEFDLVKVVNSIRIGLHNMGAWVVLQEGIGPPFKIVNMYLCPSDAAL